jgi:D-glycero-D-manno-heptose 1,7-bisphosphate phosphatase
MTPSHSLQGFVNPDGIWCTVRAPQPAASLRPAMFLDRDGVIVEEVNYLCRAEDTRIIPGAAELIALANRAGIPVVVVTNQAGIGRGYYEWQQFHEVEKAIADLLSDQGAVLDGVFACPYHPAGVGAYALDHPCRKPRPGMLLEAAAMLGLDLGRSWIVGDKTSDLLAGRAAGLRGGVHVSTGHGARHREASLALKTSKFEVYSRTSVRAATGLVRLLARSPRACFPELAEHP